MTMKQLLEFHSHDVVCIAGAPYILASCALVICVMHHQQEAVGNQRGGL